MKLNISEWPTRLHAISCLQAVLFICSFAVKLNIHLACISTHPKEAEEAKSGCREINALLIAATTLGRPGNGLFDGF